MHPRASVNLTDAKDSCLLSPHRISWIPIVELAGGITNRAGLLIETGDVAVDAFRTQYPDQLATITLLKIYKVITPHD
jgi:hypothetical protein